MDEKFLNQLLAAAVKSGASDIHLKVGAPPVFRMGGELKEVKAPRLMPEDTRSAAALLISSEKLREQINNIKEYDGSYSIRDVGRFRVNVFRQRGTLECIMRVIPYGIPSFEDLGLPPIMATICQEERGLILVTGVTGSGKSSTLASMIGYINNNYNRHILTIETKEGRYRYSLRGFTVVFKGGPEVAMTLKFVKVSNRTHPQISAILAGPGHTQELSVHAVDGAKRAEIHDPCVRVADHIAHVRQH